MALSDAWEWFFDVRRLIRSDVSRRTTRGAGYHESAQGDPSVLRQIAAAIAKAQRRTAAGLLDWITCWISKSNSCDSHRHLRLPRRRRVRPADLCRQHQPRSSRHSSSDSNGPNSCWRRSYPTWISHCHRLMRWWQRHSPPRNRTDRPRTRPTPTNPQPRRFRSRPQVCTARPPEGEAKPAHH